MWTVWANDLFTALKRSETDQNFWFSSPVDLSPGRSKLSSLSITVPACVKDVYKKIYKRKKCCWITPDLQKQVSGCRRKLKKTSERRNQSPEWRTIARWLIKKVMIWWNTVMIWIRISLVLKWLNIYDSQMVCYLNGSFSDDLDNKVSCWPRLLYILTEFAIYAGPIIPVSLPVVLRDVTVSGW